MRNKKDKKDKGDKKDRMPYQVSQKLGGNSPFWSDIIRIALPMIIQGLVFQLQSLTDKAFLGNINTIYISAIGAAQFPLNTTLDSLVAVSTGLIIIVSQIMGAKQNEKIKEYIRSAIFYNSILSGLLFIVWFVFPQNVLALLNVDQDILPYSVQYVRVCSFYFLLLGIDASLQAMLQGMGNTKPIMYAGILKVVLNIVISWVLIFGHFGFPRMEVLGAAIGTVAANSISAAMIIGYSVMIKRKEYGITRGENTWFRMAPYKEIIKLGLPTGLEYLMWNASNLVLIRLLNGISYMAMAVYTLTFGIEIVIYAIFDGMARSTMTLMGQQIGAQNGEKANQYLKACLVLDGIVISAAILIFMIMNKPILHIFSKDSAIINEAAPFLIATAFIMLPKSLNVVIGNGIRAYSDTKWMLYSQMIGSLYVITCSFFLVSVLKLGIVAIYITLFSDEAIRAALNYHHFRTCHEKRSCRGLSTKKIEKIL